MEFFSPRFFWFFLGLVALLPWFPTASGRRLLLVAASLLFYVAWDWRYVGLLIFVSTLDYWVALALEATPGKTGRMLWLGLSLFSSLGLLGYFKYSKFLGSIFLPEHPLPAQVLPVGISFYTFKTLSYVIDVYRCRLKACRSFLDYSFFVTFFPDLIAGPIVRASLFLPQLDRKPGLNRERMVIGLNLFLQGLTKKLLVADRLGEWIEPVYRAPAAFSGPTLWAAALATTWQIYCDFSGYSDMAVATAVVLGYDLPINFDRPLAACSLTQVWRRWHITLGQWFRDYVYVPLGGNRRPVAMFVTMILVGLWHGAGWTFLAWGLLNGLGLAAHRWWQARGLRMGMVPAWLLTQVWLALTFVFFRSPSIATAQAVLAGMVEGRSGGQSMDAFWFWLSLILLVLAHLVEKLSTRRRGLDALSWLGIHPIELPLAGRYLGFTRANPLSGFLVTYWLALLIGLGCTSVSPFIYFQF